MVSLETNNHNFVHPNKTMGYSSADLKTEMEINFDRCRDHRENINSMIQHRTGNQPTTHHSKRVTRVTNGQNIHSEAEKEDTINNGTITEADQL